MARYVSIMGFSAGFSWSVNDKFDSISPTKPRPPQYPPLIHPSLNPLIQFPPSSEMGEGQGISANIIFGGRANTFEPGCSALVLCLFVPLCGFSFDKCAGHGLCNYLCM